MWWRRGLADPPGSARYIAVVCQPMGAAQRSGIMVAQTVLPGCLVDYGRPARTRERLPRCLWGRNKTRPGRSSPPNLQKDLAHAERRPGIANGLTVAVSGADYVFTDTREAINAPGLFGIFAAASLWMPIARNKLHTKSTDRMLLSVSSYTSRSMPSVPTVPKVMGCTTWPARRSTPWAAVRCARGTPSAR
jgi:hypothetical protein